MLHIKIYVYEYIWFLVALDVYTIKAAGVCIYECTHSPSFLYGWLRLLQRRVRIFARGVRRDEHFIYTIVYALRCQFWRVAATTSLCWWRFEFFISIFLGSFVVDGFFFLVRLFFWDRFLFACNSYTRWCHLAD